MTLAFERFSLDLFSSLIPGAVRIDVRTSKQARFPGSCQLPYYEWKMEREKQEKHGIIVYEINKCHGKYIHV